jgi:hypothetical protein
VWCVVLPLPLLLPLPMFLPMPLHNTAQHNIVYNPTFHIVA